MRRRALLAGLGTGVVSGCLRLSGNGDGGGNDGGSESTADGGQSTSVDGSGSSDVEYPVGLSAEGANSFLYSTHVEALRETSFHVQWTKLDRSHSTTKWKKEYRADTDGAIGNWIRNPGGPVEIYRYPGGSFWREELGDRYSYGKDVKPDWYRTVLWGVEINSLMEALSWNAPERINGSGPAVWEVTAAGVETPSTVPGYHQGRLLSVDMGTLRVDERGIIRSVRAGYRIEEDDGREFEYEIRYSVDSVGAVSVDEPDWLGTARDRRPRATAELTDDKRFVRFTIEDGNRIEADSRISIFRIPQPGKTVIQLDAPLEPGEPAYLYRSGADDGFTEGDIARGSPPTGVSVTPFDGTYQITALRKTTNYLPRVDVQA